MSDQINAHVDALKRRAKWLCHKLDSSPEYNGRLYDFTEFQALEWALDELGFPLDARATEEPPRRDSIPSAKEPRQEREWRPGTRRGRYFPGGQA